jgi:hypothetical protein
VEAGRWARRRRRKQMLRTRGREGAGGSDAGRKRERGGRGHSHNDAAKRPHVYGIRVSTAQQYFRRAVEARLNVPVVEKKKKQITAPGYPVSTR